MKQKTQFSLNKEAFLNPLPGDVWKYVCRNETINFSVVSVIDGIVYFVLKQSFHGEEDQTQPVIFSELKFKYPSDVLVVTFTSLKSFQTWLSYSGVEYPWANVERCGVLCEEYQDYSNKSSSNILCVPLKQKQVSQSFLKDAVNRLDNIIALKATAKYKNLQDNTQEKINLVCIHAKELREHLKTEYNFPTDNEISL